MGRPAGFDRRDAVRAGQDLFWSAGISAVTIDQLTAAMGLSKSSFYHAFRSREQTLFEALGMYIEEQTTALEVAMAESGFDAAFRASLLDVIDDNFAGRGCFLAACVTDVSARSADVLARARAGFERVIAVFARQLESERDISPEAALELGRFAAVTVAGLRTLAIAGLARPALCDAADRALATFAISPLDRI